MHQQRIVKLLTPMAVGLTLVLASLSCNMPSLDFTSELEDIQFTSTVTTDAEGQTSTPTQTPVVSAGPSVAVTATATTEIVRGPTMTPLAPPLAPQAPLSGGGPWMIYRAGDRDAISSQYTTLYIVNPDGSGRSSLETGSFSTFEGVVSPSGDRFAYILQAANMADHVPHLVVRMVPSGEIEADISLIAAEVMDALSDEEALVDRLQAVLSDVDAFAWSPHGHYLAFTGALNGTNLDLYRFDTWSNNIRRLTEGPNHACLPNWSPDGEWIVHLEVESFADGEPWNVDAMSAVAFDGSSANLLYQTGGVQYSLIKWLDDRTFLVSEVSSTGLRKLIRATVGGSALKTLYGGSIPSSGEVSFDDLQSVVAFSLREGDIGAGESVSAGVYLYFFEEEISSLVLPGDWRSVQWWQGKGVFVANGEEGTVFVRRSGEVVKRMEEIVDPIALSPDAQWMVSFGQDGAKVFTHIGVLIRQVVDGAVNQAIWEPDSGWLFLEVYLKDNPSSSHHLYVLNLDEWELQLVDLDVKGDYFWAGLVQENP
jgi:hypothetical protein